MSIVKQTAEVLNGTIAIDNTPGQGTTVRITIQRQAASCNQTSA